MILQGSESPNFDAASIVQELLGLDLSQVSKHFLRAGSVGDLPLLGLSVFLQRIFRLALQMRCEDQASLSLMTADTARAHGWGNAKLGNLANLFAVALARGSHWQQAMALLLRESESTHLGSASLPFLVDRPRASQNDELARHRARKAGYRQTPSLPKLVERLLAVDPRQLAMRFSDRESYGASLFARDPEGQTALGLESVINDAIVQYHVMVRRGVNRIRLMGEHDAKVAGRPCARLANIITLFSASLLANDGIAVVFEAPRLPQPDEEEALRGAAKRVYVDFSYEKLESLNVLCDGITHFGGDPDLTHMPLVVAAQENGRLAVAY